MKSVSESSVGLNALIKAAIDDEVITVEEREQILMHANADGIIDNQEKVLLEQLHQMIHDGSVKLVP